VSSSALWLLAHRGLTTHFHRDPAQFVARLDGNSAPAYLEQTWRWALESAGQREPAKPPLQYGIDRPRANLVVLWMRFANVSVTGEPWQARFIVRDPDAGQTNGYVRSFLLEHDEYGSELARKPQALVCENLADGTHINWGAILAPDDEDGFDRVVSATLRSNPKPVAQTW
jgi:hypothetical protein